MVKINNDYYIDADSNSYMLKQVKYAVNKKGEKERADGTIGYYTTIETALKGYLKHQSRDIVSKQVFNSIQEYLKYIQKLDKELAQLKLDV